MKYISSTFGVAALLTTLAAPAHAQREPSTETALVSSASSAAEDAAAIERARCSPEIDGAILAPILSGSAVESVDPLYSSMQSGKSGPETRLAGAILKVKPQPNVSAELLDRALECYAARCALGRALSSAPASDPFAIPNRLVSIEVTSARDGYRVAILGESPTDAEQIVARANGLVETSAVAEKRTEEKAAEPFAFGDFTWLNGNNRQTKALLDTPVFTGSFLLDVNYTSSLNHPIDHTVVGSTALSRDNEVALQFLGFGGDFHYEAARARLMTQFGNRATVVPRNDFSSFRGQFDLQTALRYVSEANGGVHLNVWNGINIDAGIFMSYVGLFSYDNFENWMYLPSFTSDNTPWFFNGIRIQMFPSDKFKFEPWIINGWQTYGKFNEMPGFGAQTQWRPSEDISFVSNDYVGWDTQNNPGRMRFHSDNSFQYRYIKSKSAAFLPQAAFSITGDIGFENGDGVVPFGGSGSEGNCTIATPCEQHFISAMAYNRFWITKEFAWSFGGGFMHNPGRYLVLPPTGNASSIPQPMSLQGVSYVPASSPFDMNPGAKFDAFDYASGIQFMPSEQITYDLEFSHRQSSVPYFAGHGGVTSPDGYQTTATPNGWRPDLVKSDTRIIAALLVRF